MNATRIETVVPGPLTTIQDMGRSGWRHIGVARAGALDPDAAALANVLVGNRLAGDADDEAVLEFTLSGPTLAFDAPVRIALCGALTDALHFDAKGRRMPVGHGRPVALPPGQLRIGRLRMGVRGWLAIAGGFDVPALMGSRSTDLRGGFGGFEGRALTRGDVLAIRAGPPLAVEAPSQPAWWSEFDDPLPPEPVIRYLPSPHPVATRLDGSRWQVDPRSNRQGLRLHGTGMEVPPGDIVSAAVAPGTIQLPPDGQPIVLLADAQTTGGYPRLGHVAAVDLPRLAQLGPGMPLRWQAIDPGKSRALWEARRAQWRRLMWLLDERLGTL